MEIDNPDDPDGDLEDEEVQLGAIVASAIAADGNNMDIGGDGSDLGVEGSQPGGGMYGAVFGRRTSPQPRVHFTDEEPVGGAGVVAAATGIVAAAMESMDESDEEEGVVGDSEAEGIVDEDDAHVELQEDLGRGPHREEQGEDDGQEVGSNEERTSSGGSPRR